MELAITSTSMKLRDRAPVPRVRITGALNKSQHRI